MTQIEQIYSILLKSVIALSFCDGLLTLFFVLNRSAIEANPFMNFFLTVDLSGGLFMMVKVMLTMGSAWLLWEHRSFKMAKAGILIAAVAYLLLSLYWCWLLFS